MLGGFSRSMVEAALKVLPIRVVIRARLLAAMASMVDQSFNVMLSFALASATCPSYTGE
jgi:hypothetical protein